jgi:hypothetical protein
MYGMKKQNSKKTMGKPVVMIAVGTLKAKPKKKKNTKKKY